MEGVFAFVLLCIERGGDTWSSIRFGSDCALLRDWDPCEQFHTVSKVIQRLPSLALPFLSTIRNVLVNADPANIDKYDENYVIASRLVMNLDEAMKVSTETIPANDRNLLTYHDAYAYFARHFGYEVIGAIQPQSFEEPSPSDIAALIDQVKSKKVKAVFGSEVFPSPVLEQIGKETGVRYVDVLRDDDLPGEPGEADHSWAGLMKFNYITIVEALGGDATALKAVSVETKIPDKANYPQ
jgi:ABC-type Zn uptake system ZnuABC Zn-binding protein ZnuA